MFWPLPVVHHAAPGMSALVCPGTLVVTLALYSLPLSSGLQVLGDAFALECAVRLSFAVRAGVSAWS